MSVTPVEEWLTKADQDYYSAWTLARQREHQVPDVICLLCQQSAEKHLKAFLVHHQVGYPRIHYLDRLNDLCADLDSDFALIEDAALILNPFAVKFRYPGEQAEASDVERALRAMEQIREFVRAKLGLSIKRSGA